LPDYMEISHRGATTYNEDTMETNQFATIAGDGQFMVWDIRFQEIVSRLCGRTPHGGVVVCTFRFF